MAGSEIRIERRISVQSGYVLAEIHLCLPVGEGNDLHNALIRLDKEIWGIPLTPRFGVLDPYGARCVSLEKSFPLTSDSIPPAIEWIDEQVQYAVGVLREVLAEYKAIANQLPQLEPLVFDLFDLDNL